MAGWWGQSLLADHKWAAAHQKEQSSLQGADDASLLNGCDGTTVTSLHTNFPASGPERRTPRQEPEEPEQRPVSCLFKLIWGWQACFLSMTSMAAASESKCIICQVWSHKVWSQMKEVSAHVIMWLTIWHTFCDVEVHKSLKISLYFLSCNCSLM